MSELATPVYLFRLVSDFSSEEIAFIGTDISSYPARINKFSLEEKASPNLLDNEYELNVSGFYLLEVYEQASSTNLDYRNSSKLLHTEKIRFTTLTNILVETYSVYQPVEDSILIPDSPVSSPGTFENSDATFSTSVPSGGTTVGADITVTDSDGSTFASPSNINIMCTPNAGGSGILYAPPMSTGAKTSYANYDDPWQSANGTHDYTKVNPLTIARLDLDNTYPWHFLQTNNTFGNKSRFTDSLGNYYANPYDGTSGTDGSMYANNYMIDHLTGLGWNKNAQTGATWANTLTFANGATSATYSDWRLGSTNEMLSVLLWEPFSTQGGTKQGALDYFPFNRTGNLEYWTGTTIVTNTTFAYTYHQEVTTGLPLNINRESKASTLSFFICRNHFV